MHKFSESEKEVCFVVESPLAVTPRLVENAYVQGKTLRLTYPWRDLEARPFEGFLKDYMVRLSVVLPRWMYNLHDAILPVRKATADAEAKRVVTSAYDLSYPSSVERKALEDFANARNVHMVEIEGRPAGHTLVDVIKDFSGIHRATIGWLWINKTLAKAHRRQVMASLAREAGRLVPGPLFASIDAENTPSLRTALNSGSKSLCATFTRRQH